MTFNSMHSISLGSNCLLDIEKEILIKDNLPIALSRIQFRILHYLSMNLGQPVPEIQLIKYVWGSDEYISRNNLHVNINRLRHKLEDNPRKPMCLLSIRNIGYVLYQRKNS